MKIIEQAHSANKSSEPIRPVMVRDGKILLLDQRRIPEAVEYYDASELVSMYYSIKEMVVRGAPVIGVSAALALAFEAKRIAGKNLSRNSFLGELAKAKEHLQEARPTAVNLRWGTEYIYDLASSKQAETTNNEELANLLISSAENLIEEDISINRAIGKYGSELLDHESSVLTHCNAGALATCGWGTALGVIRSAVEQNKKVEVYVNETRPRQQGARLTVWELIQDGIIPTLITDNMSGYLMAQGKIDVVIVGADRIASNGDVANKIGTYTLAVLAKAHGIPFYVAAPISTIDPQISSGKLIPIEERDAEEVLFISGQQISSDGVKVLNPSFDVTPASFISAIITESGVLYPPYEQSIAKIL